MKLLFLILSAIPMLVGCAAATIAPQVQIFEPLPQGRDTPIYVTAARQKEAIKQSLRKAGFHIVDRLEGSALIMRVTIGAGQGTEPCGTLNNVRFQLRSQGNNTAEATAKGWSGTCQPNVFDAISHEMGQKLLR